MGRRGTKDRKERLGNAKRSGLAATSSQDYLHLTHLLFKHSKVYAEQCVGGNCSRYTWAGLPMLLAALQAFVVEYEFILNPKPITPRDISRPEFITHYDIKGSLLDDFNDLIELRNEIIHPAHATTGTMDNWPVYLSRVKALGILESTGEPYDFVLLTQIASHRLFGWAVKVVRALYERVIMSDPARAAQFVPYLSTFDPPWFQ